MSKRTMVMVGVLSVALALGAGLLVGSQAGGSTGGVYFTGPARDQSSSPPARSLQGVGGGDMANGSPAALSSELRFALAEAEAIRIGGGGRGTSAQTPTPASTTVVSSVEQAEAKPRADLTAQPTYAPTVIISAQAPPTGSLEAQVRAAVVANFPASQIETAMAIAYRESRYQPWAVEPGGQHFGIWQVDPSIWGPVPNDINGQARQAAGIVARYGWAPWQ